MLSWHVDSVVKCGLAGTVFFAWTDEWFTGEQEISDWLLESSHARASQKIHFSVYAKSSGKTTRFCASRSSRDTVCLRRRLSYNGSKPLAPCLSR